ncbi:hypothetical protein BJ912DRAFT_1098407 [Pholiota molesta]|nr:hypothetical protein BJ912DRAFT_1098407 [Pholiota molesta]
MTLPIISKSLTDFRSSKEFVTAIADAMKTHDAAYFKANILHRDISVRNILISDSGGLLIDWDLCVTVDPAQGLSRPHKRTGTWQFMSARLLESPSHYHDIEDDRESALYVILWTALRYTKHNHKGSEGTTAAVVLEAFDEARIEDSGAVTGGSRKSGFLATKTRIRFDDRPQLNALIAELCDESFAVRYERDPGPRRPGKLADYNKGLKVLRAENWLVDTIQQF